MRLSYAVAIASTLGACASPQAPPVVVQPVNLIGSDFCQIVDEKLSWSIADTTETIRGVRRLNAKFDQRCTPGKPSTR